MMLTTLPMSVSATKGIPETVESTTITSETKGLETQEDAPLDDLPTTIAEPTVETAPTPLADDAPMSGTCGENLIWTLENGILTISGSGPMTDFKYFNSSSSPFCIEGSNIRTAIIQNGVTYIGNAAFWQCSKLTNVIIPNSVTGIGDYAFYDCRNLKNVTIPSSVVDIKRAPFLECTGLTEITVEPENENYSSKDGVLFNKEKTMLITYPAGKSGTYRIPDSVKDIKDCAFTSCINMTDVEIPMGVKTIGVHAFSGCRNIGHVSMPDSLTDIGEYAFAECKKITDIVIPDSVTNVGEYAFAGCNALESIMFSARMTEISDFILQSCKGLRCVYIPESITKIGWASFDGCFLSCICYEGDGHSWKSMEIGSSNRPLTDPYIVISYNCTKTAYKIYLGNGYPNNYETFDRSLEMCMYRNTSTKYNPQLAHMLIAMCNSVYKADNMRETFKGFGFEHTYFTQGVFLTYGIAKKQLGNEKTLVLVVIRGTEGWEEWASNIHAAINDKQQHTGFADAANIVYDQIVNSVLLGIKDLNNVDFVITGFSRGAAAANILATKLENEANRVYTYTFACPDTTVFSGADDSYPCIFNIANSNDFVSWVPETILKSGWNKYGKSYWYSENWDDFENLEMGTTAHNQAEYLSYLRSEKPLSEYRVRSEAKSALDDAVRKRDEKFWRDVKNTFLGYVGIHCPVDVEIYSSEGVLVGNIKNDIVYSMDSDKIYISIFEGEKNVYLLDSDTYTFQITATAKGTMDYSVQNIRTSDQNILDSAAFTNVKLIEGKKMSSTVNPKKSSDTENSTSIDISNVHLYVLDDNGKAESEVQLGNDGIEIPVPPAEDEPKVPDNNTTNKPDDDNITTGEPKTDKRDSIKVEHIKISGISKKIAAGKKISLTASVSPVNATNKAVAWKSSNKRYATVNSKGVVTMKKAGKGKTVTITATAKDGSGKKAAYKIKCMKGVVKKIVLSKKGNAKLKAGKSITLAAKVIASNGANKALSWKSSNTKYATVNKNGKVTAKKAGKGKTVKITANATDGSGKKVSVKVKIS